MWFPYLQEADVPGTIGDDFPDLKQSIRMASYRVRDELKTARFEVAADGRPVDQQVADAIKDATLAQLTYWGETGDESGAVAGGSGGSILSVTLPGGGAQSAATKQEARTAPAVAEILRSCPGIDWAVQY